MKHKYNSKFILYNHTDIPDEEFIQYVLGVMFEGKCSETSKGKQYCFVTKFQNNIVVFSDITKDGTNIFHMYIENKENKYE